MVAEGAAGQVAARRPVSPSGKKPFWPLRGLFCVCGLVNIAPSCQTTLLTVICLLINTFPTLPYFVGFAISQIEISRLRRKTALLSENKRQLRLHQEKKTRL